MGTISLVSKDYQQIPVERAERHPGFSPSTKTNDIAILVLSQQADISDPQTVYPACLDNTSNFPTTNVTVTGWGKTEGTSRNFFTYESQNTRNKVFRSNKVNCST